MAPSPDTSIYYDAESDVLHLDFRLGQHVPGPAVDTRLDARRIFWHDRDGGLLAIELREASRGVVLERPAGADAHRADA